MGQSIKKFIDSRRPRWERLEKLIQALEHGKAELLKGREVLEVGRLYRKTTADLARFQAFSKEGPLPEDLEAYLNQLVARSYGQIYRDTSSGWASLWDYLRITFPKTFRETALWTFLALAIFLLGSLYGFVATLTDETFAPLIVPPHLMQQVEEGEVWFDSILSIQPLASSMIMTNNISVSFLAFALGMTFGLGTVYIMVFNGLLLGTLAGLCHMHGLDLDFWSFVLPHGVIELTAIFMSGGGGLLLGTALLFPGDFLRKDALLERGRQAVRLVLGCVPLLVAAGIVEGFFSPAQLPAGFKLVMAGVLTVILFCYLLVPLPTGAPSSSRTYNAQESPPTVSKEEGP